MAGEGGQSQGATPENLSEGQGTGGAPKAPEIENNAPIKNDNGSGDGVVPKQEEQGKKDDEPVITEYVEWEDPSAQAAVELLKEAGVSPSEAAGIFDKAVASGDLRDINVKALEAKVGKTKALLIMNGVRDYHQRVYVQHQQTVSEVKQVFGGEQGWEVVKSWAQNREKNDPAFKKELDGIRADLDKGGRAAKAAANDLLNLYNGSPKTKGLGNGNIVKGEGRAKETGGPLSRAEYNAELKKAHAAGAPAAVIAQLDARRRAGMQQGI